MSELDFTIVTPSYNYSQYIREMLESVASQEGVTFEHLIYDAGSTDGTLDITREYEHVTLVVEKDKGMSDAINKGFKAAKGKWVMWLNTDDYLLPGALEKVKKFAESRMDVDVIYGGWNFIDSNGIFLKSMGVFPFQRLMMLHHSCYIASTATFFRRETTIGEGFLLNEKLRCVMDGEYYSRLAYHNKKIVPLYELVANFRLHADSISQSQLNQKDYDGVLARQFQLAESRTTRRIYGVKIFEQEPLNELVDCILYYYFKCLKGMLRLMYRGKIK